MHNTLTLDLSSESLELIRAAIREEYKAIREAEQAEQLLSVREIMELKKVKSKDTVYAWIKKYKVTGEKVGGRMKYKLSQIQKFNKYNHV
jgi:transposase